MKRRVIALLLAAVIFLSLSVPATQARAAGGLCFIACNDTLLTLDSMPYISGQTFVPSWVLSDFGIYYSYFESSQQATIFNSSRQVFIYTENGVAYDDSDNNYYAPVVIRGGVSYLPLDFVCSYFGLAWSYITGEGYGDIVRIKDSSVILTDAQFLSAASLLMQQRYNAYYGIVDAVSSPSAENSEVNRENTRVYLCFAGLPTEKVLKSLRNSDFPASFFLTEDDIKDNANLVRQLCGEGYAIGLLWQGGGYELKSAADILYEAARKRTFLVGCTEDGEKCAEYCTEQGLVYCTGDFLTGSDENGEAITAEAVISALEESAGAAVIMLESGGSTEEILPEIASYLNENKFAVTRIDETFMNGEK